MQVWVCGMKPIEFTEQNSTMHGSGEVEDLPTYRGEGKVLSCWAMSWKERLSVLFYGKVWLCVLGYTQPPVWMSVEKSPFEEVE